MTPTEATTGNLSRLRLPAALASRLDGPVLAPIRAFRLAYLPLLTVYLASGALGIIAVADSFWVKKSLTLSPADLASLAVWLQLPWTAKMVFSELVDSLPILGSQRRSYTFIGAGLIAAGLVVLAGAAGGWITFARPERLYVLAQLLVVIGSVIQEVVADAMSPEVVARVNADGSPRPQAEISRDLAMVEVLARLTYSIGAFAVGWLAGLLAKHFSYETVFLMGLVVPALSVSGGLLVRLGPSRRRAIDWRIFGGGILFAAAATLLGLSAFRFAQEIVFLLSLTVICLMLRRVMGRLDPDIRRRIALAAIMIFAFRAVPMLGEGYRWFAMDKLGFDEAFFGVLQLTGTGVGLAAMWLLTDAVVRRPPRTIVLWLTFLAALLFLPSLLLANGATRLDRADARHRRALDRAHRRGRTIPPRTARHRTAAGADRRACAGRPAGDLVCADRLAHEPRHRGEPASHQVPEPALPHRPRRLRSAASLGAGGDRHRRCPAADGDPGGRQPEVVGEVGKPINSTAASESTTPAADRQRRTRPW